MGLPFAEAHDHCILPRFCIFGRKYRDELRNSEGARSLSSQILRDVADSQASQVLCDFRDDELFDCGRK